MQNITDDAGAIVLKESVLGVLRFVGDFAHCIHIVVYIDTAAVQNLRSYQRQKAVLRPSPSLSRLATEAKRISGWEFHCPQNAHCVELPPVLAAVG